MDRQGVFAQLREYLLGEFPQKMGLQEHKTEIGFSLSDNSQEFSVIVTYLLQYAGEGSLGKMINARESLDCDGQLKINGFIATPLSPVFTEPYGEGGDVLIYKIRYGMAPDGLPESLASSRNDFMKRVAKFHWAIEAQNPHLAMIAKSQGWPEMQICTKPFELAAHAPVYRQNLLKFLGISEENLCFSPGCFWLNAMPPRFY